MPNRGQLDVIRGRREALYEAVVGLEDALATPIGDGHKWRLRVTMAVEHAKTRIEDHAEQNEGAEGMLERVLTDAPRLQSRVTQLKVDHERLEQEIDALRAAVYDVEDAQLAERAAALRDQALELLENLSRHRRRGADLIYQAYQVDIGEAS